MAMVFIMSSDPSQKYNLQEGDKWLESPHTGNPVGIASPWSVKSWSYSSETWGSLAVFTPMIFADSAAECNSNPYQVYDYSMQGIDYVWLVNPNTTLDARVIDAFPVNDVMVDGESVVDANKIAQISFAGLATEEYVNNAVDGITGINPSAYVLTTDFNNSVIAERNQTNSDISIAVADKITNTQLQNAISAIPAPDLSTLATKVELADKADTSVLTAHTTDANIHVTSADKAAWSSKADASALTSHTGDTTVHVTSGDKATWSGKADAASLSNHTGDTVIHVSGADKTNWNGKANAGDVYTKTQVDQLVANLGGGGGTGVVVTPLHFEKTKQGTWGATEIVHTFDIVLYKVGKLFYAEGTGYWKANVGDLTARTFDIGALPNVTQLAWNLQTQVQRKSLSGSITTIAQGADMSIAINGQGLVQLEFTTDATLMMALAQTMEYSNIRFWVQGILK